MTLKERILEAVADAAPLGLSAEQVAGRLAEGYESVRRTCAELARGKKLTRHGNHYWLHRAPPSRAEGTKNE